MVKLLTTVQKVKEIVFKIFHKTYLGLGIRRGRGGGGAPALRLASSASCCFSISSRVMRVASTGDVELLRGDLLFGACTQT